jgi:carboxypeptidase PM20D1
MPIRVTREDTIRIHGTNERLAVEDYGKAMAFYAQLIRNCSL